MSNSLTAHERSISKIFCNDFVYSIPGYQRPYSWKEENARELIEDLLAYIPANVETVEQLSPYFLGSIVLIKSESNPNAIVVDGQQRLTTLTILLSAIRASLNDENAKKGISELLFDNGNVIFKTDNHYRITLREKDRDFFRTYIQLNNGIEKLIDLNSSLSDSQSCIRENAICFMKRLAELTFDARLRLAQFIATKCLLVTVCTPDLDSAFRIFNVLNSRGVDLSATDILKAEILGKISEAERDAYTQKWEQIEIDLGREGFNDLFSYMRTAFRKDSSKSTLLKEFRENVPLENSKEFIGKILVPMAEAYLEISDCTYSCREDAAEVNHAFRWLNKLEFKDWVPPALKFFILYRNRHEEVLNFFRSLEILAYSMVIRKVTIQKRFERFAKLTRVLEDKNILWNKDSPLYLTAEEQTKTFEFLNGPIYETHTSRSLAIILLRLDALLSSAEAEYSHSKVTVEHVLPQNPAENSIWLDWFPEREKRESVVHRLGNLALLSRSKNSAASNYEFEKKKKIYFTKNGVSPFAITTQVLNSDIWTVDIVRDRHKTMLVELEKHFQLYDREKTKNTSASNISRIDLVATDELQNIASEFPNRGAKWSDAEESDLKRNWNLGLNLPELCKKLGRTQSGVESRLVRIGCVDSVEEARLRSANE